MVRVPARQRLSSCKRGYHSAPSAPSAMAPSVWRGRGGRLCSVLSKVLPDPRVLDLRPGLQLPPPEGPSRPIPPPRGPSALLRSWLGPAPAERCRPGPCVLPLGSPCRLRSRSIMMCRCNARAMALESLGRSRSAGMVLPGALGPWAPGSVTDCQTSDGACRDAGAQEGRAGRAEAEARCRRRRPGESRARRPLPLPRPTPGVPRAPAGSGLQPRRYPPPAPPAPPYPPSLRFPRGSCALGPCVTSGRRADSFRSRAGQRPRGSGAGKGGSGRDGCRGGQTPTERPAPPAGRTRGSAGGGARERPRHAHRDGVYWLLGTPRP